MLSDTGTLTWAERTGGRLSFGEKLLQLADAVTLQLRSLPAQLRWKLGLSVPGQRVIESADVHPPDTAAAKAAEECCRAVSPPHLVNHCLRTYLWGRIFASQSDVSYDEEVLYIASLLHDLGLTSPHATQPGEAACFAIRGASAARDLLRAHGWSASRQDAVAEAITLHLNVNVRLEQGPEAHLLNAGAAVDVTGLRYWELAPETIEAVLTRAPRLGMKRQLWDLWKAETDLHPECRGNFLNRYVQFGYRVRSAPFPE